MRALKIFLRLIMRLMGTFYIVTPTTKGLGVKISESSEANASRTDQAGNNQTSLGTIPKRTQTQTTTTTTTVTVTTASLTPTTTTVTGLPPLFDTTQVSWIETLADEYLGVAAMRYGLDSSGSPDDIRRRLMEYHRNIRISRGGTRKPTNLEYDTTLPPYVLPQQNATRFSEFSQQTTERAELDSIKEILQLSPNADFCAIRRTLTELVQTTRAQATGFERSWSIPDYNRPASTHVTYSQGLPGNIPFPGIVPNSTNYANYDRAPWNPNQVRYQASTSNDLASLCATVRKWNLRFDGRRDPVSFLERLDEVMESYSVAPDDVLKAMPELLVGSALLWYRNCKELFSNFAEFRRQFEIQFLPPGYCRTLDEEIRKRTQGHTEPFRDYVVAISTLIRRRGTFSGQEKLELIFTNMRPDYKIMVRRQDFGTLAQLIERAEDYEAYLRERNAFRPPPPPAMALVQETAYRHRKSSDRAFDSLAIGKDEVFGEQPPFQPRSVKKDTYHGGKRDKTQQSPSRDHNVSHRLNQPHTEKLPSPREVNSNRTVIDQRRFGAKVSPDTVCWNCDAVGHLYRDCKIPKHLRCFYCKADGVPTTQCRCRQENHYRARVEGGPSSTRPHTNTRPPKNGANGSSL